MVKKAIFLLFLTTSVFAMNISGVKMPVQPLEVDDAFLLIIVAEIRPALAVTPRGGGLQFADRAIEDHRSHLVGISLGVR